MRSIPFWCIVLLVWIVGGIFAFQNLLGCCGFAGAPLLIKDGATTVGQCSSNLLFGASAFVPMMGDEVKTEYKDVGAYLKANPDKNIMLTGLYGKSETFKKGTGGFDNLGLARADAVKKHLLALGVPAGQLLTGAKLADVDEFEGKVHGPMEYTINGLNRNISIKDGTAFSAGVADNFLFTKGGFEHAKPVSKELNDVFAKTATYLKGNAKRSISLTGLYGKDEKYTGILSNLGLARANDVKNYLISLGAPAGQINTLAQEKSGIKFINNYMTNGVTYAFDGAADTGNRLAEVEARLKANPMILYFETNSDKLNLNSEQRKYFSDLIYYLDNKKGAKVFSTGHTDNAGQADSNRRLGRKRAQFVVNYLAKNGINTRAIQTKSEGQNKPIATNNTEEGKAKNRRVEITVQ